MADRLGEPPRFDPVAEAIVEVNRNGAFSGTGFFVLPDGHLLTCAHVAFGGTAGIPHPDAKVTVRFRGNDYSARFLPECSDVMRDIACFHIATAGMVPFPLLGTEVATSDRFLIYGFQRHRDGYRRYPVTGVFAGPTTQNIGDHDFSDSQDLLVLNSPNMEAGLSGSPVLNIRTQRVVGMAKRQFFERGVLVGGYAIPTSSLCASFPDLMSRNASAGFTSLSFPPEELLRDLVAHNCISSLERHNARSVYRLTRAFWTNVSIRPDEVIARPEVLRRLALAVGKFVVPDCNAIVDLRVFGYDERREQQLVREIARELSLPIGDISFSQAQAVILPTLRPKLINALQTYASAIRRAVIILGPSRSESQRVLHEYGNTLDLVLSTDDLDALDESSRWRMING